MLQISIVLQDLVRKRKLMKKETMHMIQQRRIELSFGLFCTREPASIGHPTGEILLMLQCRLAKKFSMSAGNWRIVLEEIRRHLEHLEVKLFDHLSAT